MTVLDLTPEMARRADRYDRRRLAQKAWAEREAARLRAHRLQLAEAMRA
ncbi:MAG: hypothetical protein J7500_15680 [Sphingomonas sp.]|nr:hypothetical protein [Sphingomonas sp.]MBO9624148.1 hypothetical protein [Sphingomonas sp.]